jgi:uncharacterized protein (DUF1810 family)
MQYDLNRFIAAQEHIFEQALAEIQAGKKRRHWMWFIFPQYKGLGSSSTSMEFAIKSKEEAIAYFNHPILGKRLEEITTYFYHLEGKLAYSILGYPDDKKMQSCMTLFESIPLKNSVFTKVLEKYFEGRRCQRTLDYLNSTT